MSSPRRLLQAFVFLGAALLFGLEPLVGKLLLPSFGGSFHVWATCLMFFQAMLLLGYVYCHALAPRLGRWHLLLVLAPLAALPLVDLRTTPDPGRPLAALIGLLATHVALPFGALATTGVIAQSWLAAASDGEEDPYRLYAASNLGSLVALLAYPLVVEPLLPLSVQRGVWSAGYLVYLALALRAGWSLAPAARHQVAAAGPRPPLGTGRVASWFLLAMAPSVALSAVTNVIALDVGSFPLVWVLPLALYLGSFVLVFGRRSIYPRPVRALWPVLCSVGLYFFATADEGFSWAGAVVHLAVLGAVCLVGHGELHRLRPAPARLTAFYLVLSLGGFAGGLFVGVAAPALLSGLWEYPLALALLAAAVLLAHGRELPARLRGASPALLAGTGLVMVGLAAHAAWWSAGRLQPLATHRNFYGVYRVYEGPHELPGGGVHTLRVLLHGTTQHGKQLVHPEGRKVPLSYFHPRSPLGDVMTVLPRPRRAAVIGLGTGTTAAYFDAGDELTFYELDPDNERLAREFFTYLGDCRARLAVVPGDALVSLRAAGPEARGLDLLMVDAFSSDAIPTHLLTREALLEYGARVRPDGLLLFHISNRYYDLKPVLAATAAATPGLSRVGIFRAWDPRWRNADPTGLGDPSEYFALAPEGPLLDALLARGWRRAAGAGLPALRPWTDDFASPLAPLLVRQGWWR